MSNAVKKFLINLNST